MEREELQAFKSFSGDSMDESPLQLVSEIGDNLCRLARPNKDFLVKSLRRVANTLSQIEQPLETHRKTEGIMKLEAAVKPLRKSILKHDLMKHTDKEVRLLVAICVSEVFRILAPEPPFEDKYLRVARLLLSSYMEHHQQSLINEILSIMKHILNEEASQALSDVILLNLIKEGKAAPHAASQLAASVIQACAEKLEPLVCGFLTTCFLDRDAVESELKEFYHEILFKVCQCAPHMLLAVIPNLTQELLTDQVDVRLKAVNLIGKLFALPEHHVVQKYHNLFVEFKNRFSDKSAEVRLSALQCAKACYISNPSGNVSLEILSKYSATALEGRLLDFDDRVRTQAAVVICDLARSNLKFFPPELISKVTERLRDKKISVRKKALQKLMEVYRHYCIMCSEGHMTASDHFEQIPCKVLMLSYDKDCKDFRPQNMELVIAEDLFPLFLPVEERTQRWIHLFSLFTPFHVKALKSILYQKRRLQADMQIYLVQRKKEKDSSSEEMEKRIKNSFVKMSASFPDPLKAEEYFHKLNQMKDNKTFNALEQLLDDQTIKSAQTSRASAELLLAIISVFPSLMRGFEEKFQVLLEEQNPINDTLVEVLAKAGPHIKAKFSVFYPFLERICLKGTRVQSKHAVSAIASMTGSSDTFIFSKLCKELVDALYSGWNAPTVLQSLGCIAQHSVSAFEAQDQEIRSYIFGRIFQMEPSKDQPSLDDTSECCDSCKLKVSVMEGKFTSELSIYALKALAKSFLPHRGSHVKWRIDELLDILSKMLQMGDTFDGINLCTSDKPHIKLAAAKAVLQLSRRWDLCISPEIFRSTVLMAKESCSFVGRSFLDKTHKLLKERVIPSRYACAYPLAASDHCKDLQDASFKYMEEFIKDYSKEARMRQTSGVQGSSCMDYPSYIVVFLIHVLAHDAGFPPDGCHDEQALVNASIVNGDMEHINDAVLYLLLIFRAIRKTEDAVDAHATPKLVILAEIGIAIVNELNHNGSSSSLASGMCFLLPSSLYRISVVKKCEEASFGRTFNASLKRLAKFSVGESFLKRVVHILKSQMSGPASTLSKRRKKGQEVSIQSSDVERNTSNPVSQTNARLSLRGTREKQKTAAKEIGLGCQRKRAVSPIDSESAVLPNKRSAIVMHKDYASKSSKSILEESRNSSSCVSATLKLSQLGSHVLKADSTIPSLKENAETSRSITTSKYSKAELKETHRLRIHVYRKWRSCHFDGKMRENCVNISRRIYVGISEERSGGYHNPEGKCISYDSGDLLCLDSESRETMSDNSLLEKVTAKRQESFNPAGYPSLSSQKETCNAFGDGAAKQTKCLASMESRRFSNRVTSLPAKGKNGQKILLDTSASEIINVNEDCVSLEPAPGVDLEGLEVAKECLGDAFKLDSPTIDDNPVEPGLLIDLFRSVEANEHQKNKSDFSRGTTPVDAPTSSYAYDNTNDGGLIRRRVGLILNVIGMAGLSRDELFGQFFAALEKMHFFRTTPDGNDDPAQLDRATRLFHDALNEMEKNGCHSYDRHSLAEALKSQGNRAVQYKLYSDAIELYSCAISLCENNAVYYCNRAAAYTQVHKYNEAIRDCLKSVEIDPGYSKAYSRLGLAYYAQGNYRDAIDKGFKKDMRVLDYSQVAEQKLKEQQQRTERDQNTSSSNVDNHEFSNQSTGSRSHSMPMQFNINGIPVDFASMLRNMTGYMGEQSQDRQGEGGSGNGSDEPDIRIGGNIGVNLTENMPDELRGAFRSVMEMFSGAASHGNDQDAMNGRSPTN
ncbi:unnamed protein product [Dovyalis caffra]|uniref:Uncharacterized protein n=1 Tax=Dovyalis caffra TaxID=77055 RepID=A0AAV1S7U6_9ROSI|nr:unnamed protein product [Dovyalis caffra]